MERDIVERLRGAADEICEAPYEQLLREAADEIKRLRANERRLEKLEWTVCWIQQRLNIWPQA